MKYCSITENEALLLFSVEKAIVNRECNHICIFLMENGSTGRITISWSSPAPSILFGPSLLLYKVWSNFIELFPPQLQSIATTHTFRDRKHWNTPQQRFQTLCKTDKALAFFSNSIASLYADSSKLIANHYKIEFCSGLCYLRFSFCLAEGPSITAKVVSILY